MAFIGKHLTRRRVGGNQKSACSYPQQPSAKPLANRQPVNRGKRCLYFYLFTVFVTHSMIFHALAVLPSANPPLLSVFTPFLSLPMGCKNPTLLSKYSLIGLNRWFGLCALTSPQNVPALCRSKGWEDAGHKDAGRGWSSWSNKKNKTDLFQILKLHEQLLRRWH